MLQPLAFLVIEEFLLYGCHLLLVVEQFLQQEQAQMGGGLVLHV